MKKKPIEIPTTPEKPTVYPTEPPTPGPSRDPEVKPVVTPPVIIPEPEVPPPPSDLEKKMKCTLETRRQLELAEVAIQYYKTGNK